MVAQESVVAQSERQEKKKEYVQEYAHVGYA